MLNISPSHPIQPPSRQGTHFGARDSTRIFYLEPHTAADEVMGYTTEDSTPLPLLTDHHTVGEIPKGTRIQKWPLFSVAPKSVPLQTSGMVKCCAVVINGPGDKHYMMHLSPSLLGERSIEKHLRRDIPWDLNDKDTCIDIIPGISPNTKYVVQLVLNALRHINPALPGKVHFRHFPDATAAWGPNDNETDSTLNNPRAVVSYDGDVFCHERYSAQPPLKPGGKRVHRLYPAVSRFA